MSETWHGILLGPCIAEKSYLSCSHHFCDLLSVWGGHSIFFLFFDPSDISRSLHIFVFVVEYCLVKVNILSTYFLLLKGQNAYYLKKTRHTPIVLGQREKGILRKQVDNMHV